MAATRGDNVLLQDDFNDTSLNAQNWTAYRAYCGQTGYPAGSSVTLAGGVVTVAQDQMDHGGWLVSRPLTFAPSGLITIRDRVYVHAENGYTYGGTALGDMVQGSPGAWYWEFGVQHSNNYYPSPHIDAFTLGERNNSSNPGETFPSYGGSDGDGHKFGQVGAVWDTWVNEEITVDPKTNVVTYSVDGGPVISGTLSTPMPQKPLTLVYDSYCWYTGSYEKIDSVSVTQVPEPSSLTLLGLATVGGLARRRRRR